MPVEEALYVVIIASKTGWNESFIRHELPLSRGHAYYHAIRLLDGEHCRWPGLQSSISQHVANVMKWARSFIKSTPGG